MSLLIKLSNLSQCEINVLKVGSIISIINKIIISISSAVILINYINFFIKFLLIRIFKSVN